MRIYLIGCMPEGKNSDLEERIMKILLAAVNAKYIHSNLAVYSLKETTGYSLPFLLYLEFGLYRRNCAGNRKAASGYANLAWRAGGFL